MLVLFIIGVITFLIYAATTFTERNIGWVTSWIEDDRGFIWDDSMW